MRKVVLLTGRMAGNEEWMNEHEAEAALATGAVALPGSNAAVDIQARLGLLDQSTPQHEGRRELALRRGDTGATELVGDFPERLTLAPGFQNTRFVRFGPSGDITIDVNGRRAKYKAVGDYRGEVFADLVAVETPAIDPGDAEESYADTETEAEGDTGEEEQAETEAPAIEIPEDWRRMHWKQRVALASRIAGHEIKEAEEANAIIAHHAGE